MSLEVTELQEGGEGRKIFYKNNYNDTITDCFIKKTFVFYYKIIYQNVESLL